MTSYDNAIQWIFNLEFLRTQFNFFYRNCLTNIFVVIFFTESQYRYVAGAAGHDKASYILFKPLCSLCKFRIRLS